jgi:hypothetical protein
MISRMNDVNKVITSAIAMAHLAFSLGHFRSNYKLQIYFIMLGGIYGQQRWHSGRTYTSLCQGQGFESSQQGGWGDSELSDIYTRDHSVIHYCCHH